MREISGLASLLSRNQYISGKSMVIKGSESAAYGGKKLAAEMFTRDPHRRI
jgi:hypothetical protein